MCRYVLLKTRAFKASPEKKNVATNQLLAFPPKVIMVFRIMQYSSKSYKFYFSYQARLQVELMAKCFIPLDYGNTYNMVWLKQSTELQY